MKYHFLLAICLPIVTLSAQTEIPVTGMVIWLQDISDQKVNYKTLTDMQGIALFEQVPAGDYNLLVEVDGNQLSLRNEDGHVQRFVIQSSTNATVGDHHFSIPISTGHLKAKVHQSVQQLQVELLHLPDKYR
ncbi:MAG: hypothetical protein KA479_04150 [Saprospiraceae bacterium]|jgi:hypothetical protein|nr:hypothetical protein [Saprospiraceae bacterium]